MATYGLMRDEIAQIVRKELQNHPSDLKKLQDAGLEGAIDTITEGVARAIEQNNRRLARQIINEVRGEQLVS
jgi:hypothetical protein